MKYMPYKVMVYAFCAMGRSQPLRRARMSSSQGSVLFAIKQYDEGFQSLEARTFHRRRFHSRGC